jgi:hypothetical protein
LRCLVGSEHTVQLIERETQFQNGITHVPDHLKTLLYHCYKLFILQPYFTARNAQILIQTARVPHNVADCEHHAGPLAERSGLVSHRLISVH